MLMTSFSYNSKVRRVIMASLSDLFAREEEILDNLNNLKLRSLKFREARVLGARNPSQLHPNDKVIWKRKFKVWFEAEIQDMNESLTEIRRKKDEYMGLLRYYLVIEVIDNRSLETIIYLKQQYSTWNGSAVLGTGLTQAQREEFKSELIRNEIQVRDF